MSMSSMSIESEDNGEFAAIATGERSDGGQLGTRGKEQKEKIREPLTEVRQKYYVSGTPNHEVNIQTRKQGMRR